MFIFGLFNLQNNLTANICENGPTSIWHWESTSHPLRHESPSVTTRLCFYKIIIKLNNVDAVGDLWRDGSGQANVPGERCSCFRCQWRNPGLNDNCPNDGNDPDLGRVLHR